MCRLDSLVGLFAVGCQPTAAADPFGLRRSAYGLVFTQKYGAFCGAVGP